MRVGMVSIYPSSKSKYGKQSGVASYSKNLVDSLLKYCSLVVFAEKLSVSEDDYYEGAAVIRCWSKGVKYPFQIFKKLLENKVDVVHIQYETYLYGGLASALVFPVFLGLGKLLRKPVIITMHGIIPLSKVDRCFLEENQINGNPLIMRFGLISLIKIVASLSTGIIVHEKKLMDILIKEYKCCASKISVIHHGVEKPKFSIASNEAKEKLGLVGKRVILFFGYITGYKNVDLLIDSAKFLKVDDWVLLIAGGTHPRLSGDSSHLKYLSDLRKKASAISEEKILFRGFIPEEEISLYFAAADLVVFPYNICISSSGPLSLAASYGKPFLVANSFRGIVDSDYIMFENDPEKLANNIDCFFADPTFRLKGLAYSRDFKIARSWDNIANKTIMLYKHWLNP